MLGNMLLGNLKLIIQLIGTQVYLLMVQKLLQKITPYGIGNVSSSPILLLGKIGIPFSTTGAIEGKLMK